MTIRAINWSDCSDCVPWRTVELFGTAIAGSLCSICLVSSGRAFKHDKRVLRTVHTCVTRSFHILVTNVTSCACYKSVDNVCVIWAWSSRRTYETVSGRCSTEVRLIIPCTTRCHISGSFRAVISLITNLSKRSISWVWCNWTFNTDVTTVTDVLDTGDTVVSSWAESLYSLRCGLWGFTVLTINTEDWCWGTSRAVILIWARVCSAINCTL